jgi:hypothetical protein
VVDDAVFKAHTVGQGAALMQVFVHHVAPGVEHAGDGDFVADLQRADLFLCEWESEFDHVSKANFGFRLCCSK